MPKKSKVIFKVRDYKNIEMCYRDGPFATLRAAIAWHAKFTHKPTVIVDEYKNNRLTNSHALIGCGCYEPSAKEDQQIQVGRKLGYTGHLSVKDKVKASWDAGLDDGY